MVKLRSTLACALVFALGAGVRKTVPARDKKAGFSHADFSDEEWASISGLTPVKFLLGNGSLMVEQDADDNEFKSLVETSVAVTLVEDGPPAIVEAPVVEAQDDTPELFTFPGAEVAAPVVAVAPTKKAAK